MKPDLKLKQDVLAQLDFDPSVNPAHIGVTAQDGVVTLTGTVETLAEKFSAVKIAERVKGVRGLADEIEVKLSNLHQRSDTDIAEAALALFKWDWVLPPEGITVKVQRGWVTLEGSVFWEYQRRKAHQLINNMIGVAGVSNNLKLKPHLQPNAIETDIRHAFERHAALDSQRVKVEIVGGKVTLTGNLPSWFERDEAVHAAWSAPGVTEVKNQIVIDY
jgi:osmotically-inducible protein OsmY